MFKWGLILLLGLSLSIPVFSQEKEIEWIWGEVISLDKEKGEIKVKYLDYETDEEKEVTIICDPETKFENVSGFEEIKIGDSASIDYVIEEGKNIAKNISIEKEEFPLEELQP